MELLKKTPRIEVVDALRGFAVMAILLVHNLEHFIFPVYPESSPEWLSVLDAGVFNAIFSLFAGKSYAIFALLFGFTFYIQSHNQQLKGKDFGYRFLWRLVLLAGFATLNAAFFPAGDVLLLFVVVGIILFIVRKWSDKAILITAIIFSLQPIEWFHYIMSLFNPAYTLPDLNVGAMYSEVADYTKNGTFLGIPHWQCHIRTESELVLGHWCRTFLTDCRTFPVRSVHRTQRTVRHFRVSSEILDQSTDHCSYQFRSALLFERADHAK